MVTGLSLKYDHSPILNRSVRRTLSSNMLLRINPNNKGANGYFWTLKMVAKKAKPINSPRSKTLKVVRKTPINDRLMTIGNNIG